MSKLKFLSIFLVVLFILAISMFQVTNLTGFFVLNSPPRVKVIIDDGEKIITNSVQIGARESALDALIRVATVEYKTFGELGAKITEINGKKENENHVWLFLVNNKLSDVPCSHYYPNNEDVLIFKYTTLEEAETYF